jgi:hypothetical protein
MYKGSEGACITRYARNTDDTALTKLKELTVVGRPFFDDITSG